ncbi:MAG: serine/threonine protein kinase, partial [Bdellovibrio sp.]
MKKRSQTLLEDTHVGPYKIIKKIGEGGMGTVYEAVEDLLGRRVALKFITREYEEKKEELLKRFYIEAKALAQVHHPNIVTIYSIGEFEGEPYIAMEYVQGKTLKEYLRKKGSFSLEEAIPIFLQLLKAVKALHDRGIIHRDLKPHNIIIQDDGTAKIVDFGIAKLSDNDVDVTRAGAVLGSVRYMSPEMATGKNATKQSDIRSLGIIFYEMLVGKSPYEAKEFHLLIQEVIKKDIRIPVSAYVKVPLEWRNLLNKMCERDRKKRYESIDDILLDFQSAYGLDISNSLSISLGMQKSLENISKRQNFRKYVALGVA